MVKFFECRPNILMYCGNGYSFGEYFKPIIEDLIGDCRIKFLQGGYHLASATIRSLENVSQRKFFSYQIVHAFDRMESAFDYHKGISQLINSLSEESFNLLIVNTDSNLLDRYLINFARAKGMKVVIAHANIMTAEVLRSYRENKGIKNEKLTPGSIKAKINKLHSSENKTGVILSYILKHIRSAPLRISRHWKSFANHYLWPWFFSKTVFRKNKYDKFSFTSGRGDAVICYDPMDMEALKSLVPTVKNIYLARHPSVYYSADIPKDISKKLLVLLTSYLVELPEDQFIFWRDTIRKISQETGVTEIHIRFHPRTDSKLIWPKKLIEAIRNLGLKLVIVDSKEKPLAEIAANYVGIVGTVSGSLRTARAASRGFVIGLLAAGGDSTSLWDEDWMLGACEGINWISRPEEIQPKHFTPFSLLKTNRLTVAEILKKILLNPAKRNISVIIQARMGSERLFGKVLMEVAGRPLLDYMIERVNWSCLIDQVIIATTTSSKDDKIVQWCQENSVKFYRGDEEDVLGRYYRAAKECGASIIVRVTSDCPLIDPEVLDEVIQCYLDKDDTDFVSNTVPLPCLYPDGMDVEVFDKELLEKTHLEAQLSSEREHVTFYMWKTDKFKTYRLDPGQDLSKYRFCVDYWQDFELIKEILTRLYPENPRFSMYDLIEFMNKNPKLLELQAGIERNAGWQRAFDKDRQYSEKTK